MPRFALDKNRIGWAQDRLKRAGYSNSPRRGYWDLTSKGRDLATQHPVLGDALVRQLANSDKSSPTNAGPESGPGTGPGTSTVPLSPDDRLEAAHRELNERVAADLLEQIGRASPAFFEGLVLDLLHAMGYGSTRDDLRRVGRSGDGGIDGIISLDKLGLEKVYVQAKRWQPGNNVGRPDVQGFFGALAGRRADKGVFITTSAFSREAQEFAASVSDSIVLVDGERLAQLLIDHEVGVSLRRTIRLVEVDSDYFEEG